MSDLSGKKALVTGAGMGIGQGIAVELARRGAQDRSCTSTAVPRPGWASGGTRETVQSNARRANLTRIHIGITMSAGEGLLESYRQG
ncbi:MAG TPA: hypothetical protein VFH16_16225 [Rubrobacter sp.]|nr:hypothetical protein [Rubrobacter sp.]